VDGGAVKHNRRLTHDLATHALMELDIFVYGVLRLEQMSTRPSTHTSLLDSPDTKPEQTLLDWIGLDWGTSREGFLVSSPNEDLPIIDGGLRQISK